LGLLPPLASFARQKKLADALSVCFLRTAPFDFYASSEGPLSALGDLDRFPLKVLMLPKKAGDPKRTS